MPAIRNSICPNDPMFPWRVSWGFGAYRDFQTVQSAQRFYRYLDEQGLAPFKPLLMEKAAPLEIHEMPLPA